MLKKPLIPLADKKPLKRLQQEPITTTRLNERPKLDPPKLIKSELNHHNVSAANVARSISGQQHHQHQSGQVPAPPPLYKAPVLGHATTNASQYMNCTSANSSRLASASGMNNTILPKTMPKLQPMTRSPSSLQQQPSTPPSPLPPPSLPSARFGATAIPPRAMPKLKPLLPVPLPASQIPTPTHTMTSATAPGPVRDK